MKRPNRNIEIFSMSVLDMFASALGAFILIAIILFPNHAKVQAMQEEMVRARQTIAAQQARIADLESRVATQRDQLNQLTTQLQDARSQLQRSQALAQQLQAEVAQSNAELVQARQTMQNQQQTINRMAAELSKTFIVATIEWETAGDNVDIDLHVTDPQGHEFDFTHANRNSDHRDFPDSEAQLSRDSTHGPGIEVWQDPQATVGDYKIEYVFYATSPPINEVSVVGNVYTRKGRVAISAQTLTFDGTKAKKLAAVVHVDAQGDVEVH